MFFFFSPNNFGTAADTNPNPGQLILYKVHIWTLLSKVVDIVCILVVIKGVKKDVKKDWDVSDKIIIVSEFW